MTPHPSPTSPAATDLVNVRWRKSSHSGGQHQCVEVAGLASQGVAVRDSTNPTGPTLTFSRVAWRTFINDLRRGHPDHHH